MGKRHRGNADNTVEQTIHQVRSHRLDTQRPVRTLRPHAATRLQPPTHETHRHHGSTPKPPLVQQQAQQPRIPRPLHAPAQHPQHPQSRRDVLLCAAAETVGRHSFLFESHCNDRTPSVL